MRPQSIIEALRKDVEPLTTRALNARAVLNPSVEVLRKFVELELFIAPNDFRALAAIAQKARDDEELDFVGDLIGSGPKWSRSLWSLAERLSVRLNYELVEPLTVGYSMLLSWLAVNGTMGDLAVLVGVNFDTFCTNTTRLAEWAESHGLSGVEFMKCRGLSEERLRRAERIAQRYLDWDRYRFVARAAQSYEAMFWESLSP